MLLSSTPPFLPFARLLHVDALQAPEALLAQNQLLHSQCSFSSGHLDHTPSNCYREVSSAGWDLCLMCLCVLQGTEPKTLVVQVFCQWPCYLVV